MKFDKNIEIFSGIVENTIDFLNKFVTDERFSQPVRDSLKLELDLFRKRDAMKSSSITSPGMYLTQSENDSTVSYRLGKLEVTMMYELPRHEIETIKKLCCSMNILICYMNVRTTMTF